MTEVIFKHRIASLLKDSEETGRPVERRLITGMAGDPVPQWLPWSPSEHYEYRLASDPAEELAVKIRDGFENVSRGASTPKCWIAAARAALEWMGEREKRGE